MSRISDPVNYKFVPVEINEVDIYTGILKLLSFIRPEWTAENIKFKVGHRHVKNMICLFKVFTYLYVLFLKKFRSLLMALQINLLRASTSMNMG